MTKKDRIAIVVSILYLLLPLIILFERNSKSPAVAILLSSLLIAYWGYRFIKGDISFIKGVGGEKK